jgi:inward rectifier potassium channel
LIGLSWPAFIGTVLLSYLLINLVFSLMYLAIGIDHLPGHDAVGPAGHFWDAFFFSAQTLTTVGYGRISPDGFAASLLAAVESFTGLMGFALATGLLYSRFARPEGRMLFSGHALIAAYREGSGFMFRVANARKNQLIETEVQVSLSMVDKHGTRRFHDLPLERKKIHFFPLSWTVVHPITPYSPLWGMTARDFAEGDGEFFVQMKAFDDAFSQTLYVRSSYRFDEIVFGARFRFIFGRNEAGATTIDLHRLDDHEPAALPPPATGPSESPPRADGAPGLEIRA